MREGGNYARVEIMNDGKGIWQMSGRYLDK